MLSKSSEAAATGPYERAPDYTTPSQLLIRADPQEIGFGGPNIWQRIMAVLK